ncbi:MAG TPA: DUF2189 domain-containing protein [Afifellaceae bacterium]|nr:DUF2189 domain-containing protein [Afifellaceae bacterium]
MTGHIRNPIESIGDWFVETSRLAAAFMSGLSHREKVVTEPPPAIAEIEVSDLREVLAKGVNDLGAFRTDAIFLVVIYPIAGLVLFWLAINNDMLPLVFPILSGFALLGPIAGVGLCELSRRRDEGIADAAADTLAVARSPAFGSIVWLGLLLVAIFLAWVLSAYVIFRFTLGPEAPTSIGAFLSDVFTTGPGWAMIVAGFAVGFCYALLVLVIGVISFPMLLDRNVGVAAAIATSIRAVARNPAPMAAWGLIVAAGLALGALPALLGLVIVMPVLAHANWHLYRKVVR